jgi:pyridoxal phosphate enzyme (YggS family)
MSIGDNYHKIEEDIPDYVAIVLAAKTRTPQEIEEAIEAGATNIGANYVQEAEKIHNALGEKAKKVLWHMIGHLQKNKVNKALPIFDVIQTVDSLKLAEAISKRAGKVCPVYIEINSGREPQKSGVMPEDVEELIRQISHLENVKIEGLMTMGPRFGNPEDARPFFKETKKLFDYIKGLDLPNVKMEMLSMGMSNAYKVAIEEGSTMIRPGSIVFGERPQ